jgi:hypothetical protein
MKIYIKALLTAGSLAAIAVPFSAWADKHESDDRHSRAAAISAPPEAVKKECGSCHMVFPPEMLPERSWKAIMEGLSSHFGENATLDPEKLRQITDWHVTNAGDASGANSHYLRGLMQSQTPLRISETAYWIKEHRKEVRDSDFAKPAVKSKANCVACHKDAERGVWEDD